MKRFQTGFTLIELIIVVVLLGIMAATALPKFISTTDNAKTSTLQQLMAQIQATIELNNGYANVKQKNKGKQTITLEEVGEYSFNQGYPENKSEATVPNKFFFDLLNITKGAKVIEQQDDVLRKMTLGDLRLFENETVSRIGYGQDDLSDSNCVAEYSLSDSGNVTYLLKTTGC